MNIEDWKHVTKEQKEFLWSDIKTHFRLENDDVKVPTLLSCGAKWKAWKTELREASERGKQYQMNRPRLGPKGYCSFEEKAPHDKDGNTTLLPELADLSKDLTKASQQLSEGTIESKAGVDPLIMVMGPEHGEDYEEMEIQVLQKVKAVIKTIEFWEEMRVEIRRELESESNEGLSTGKDEVEFPRQSVASTTSIIKLSCIKEETYCCLYVPSSVSTHEKVTCATATIFPIGDGLIHGNKLLKGHMKVSVIKVVDFHKNMELPVPNDEFPTLLNAVKGFIQWPISAIARFKGLTKTLISRAPTKNVLPQHQKVSGIEQGKGKVTTEEPTNKKKALEESTKPKMALAKIAEQIKAKERDEKRKAEYGKKLNELKHAITLHRPKSVLDGYNRWMSRGKDCVEPYNLRVDKEVFRQAEDSYFAINPTDIIELLTNKKLELGILTCFEMSLYQLKGRSQQNKVGFLHPEMITPDVYGADKGVTLDYLARALEGYEFYVAPYLQGFSLTGAQDGDVKLWMLKCNVSISLARLPDRHTFIQSKLTRLGGVFRIRLIFTMNLKDCLIIITGFTMALLGDTGMMGGFATRVAGYADLYKRVAIEIGRSVVSIERASSHCNTGDVHSELMEECIGILGVDCRNQQRQLWTEQNYLGPPANVLTAGRQPTGGALKTAILLAPSLNSLNAMRRNLGLDSGFNGGFECCSSGSDGGGDGGEESEGSNGSNLATVSKKEESGSSGEGGTEKPVSVLSKVRFFDLNFVRM
ncbi:hypothetical protein Tco_0971089 [Tanacetum coccineum]